MQWLCVFKPVSVDRVFSILGYQRCRKIINREPNKNGWREGTMFGYTFILSPTSQWYELTCK